MARLTGARGSVYLAGSSTKVADTMLWEYEETQEVLDASIKGEYWRVNVADQAHAHVRIQGWVTGSPGTPLTSVMHSSNVAAHGAGTRVVFVLETENVSNVAGVTVQGAGYLVHSQVHVARDGLITDELEIEVDGTLTTVV